MQSSFSVIKNVSVNHQGGKKIETNFQKQKNEENSSENISEDSLNTVANCIIENARYKASGIIEKAQFEAASIEQEAYTKGFNNGVEEGRKKAYEEYVAAAKSEAEAIIAEAKTTLLQAKQTLFNAHAEYELYLDNKKTEIKDTVITIANTILNKEIQSEDALNELLFNLINEEKKSKTYLIKCNSRYVEELKAVIERLKTQMIAKSDIFVVSDDNINLGNIIIEKDNGRIVAGVDPAIEKIKQILEEND